MSNSLFIEDIFFKFYQNLPSFNDIEQRDQQAIDNFFYILSNNDRLTSNQGLYLIRILKKYKSLDYSKDIDNLDIAIWKHPFRKIDLSKQVWIEESEESLDVCLKFPFSFKKIFEDYFLKNHLVDQWDLRWDSAKKINVIPLYKINIIHLHEFLSQHGFEFNDEFYKCLGIVEEIWENQENLEPYMKIIDGNLNFFNVSKNFLRYFEKNSNKNIFHDLLIGKICGIPLKLDHKPANVYEKICSTSASFFWIKDLELWFEIFKNFQGPVAIILDRTDDNFLWIRNFIEAADRCSVDRKKIKVCFRESNAENSDFNIWVKNNDVGGKIEEGEIFIFQHKPGKWLFKNEISVKMIVTNSVFPLTSQISQKMLDSHPLVVNLGPIKASRTKEISIVEL